MAKNDEKRALAFDRCLESDGWWIRGWGHRDPVTELLQERGRDLASVKRSFMGPFANFQGSEGIERLEAYIEAGCQRFMMQLAECLQ